jgi:cell division protein FtsL
MNIQWALAALFVLVLATAVGVIFSKHESRKLFVQLQTMQNERDQIQIEWGRMQLEQSTWATHSRIERLARTKLDMKIPLAENVIIIRP